MSFPLSINKKIEFKSLNLKPESLRDKIVSLLADQKYLVHTDNLKIIVSNSFTRRSGWGADVLVGLSKGEIRLYPKENSLIAVYKFSMLHLFIVTTVFIGLLFLINIKNPITTTPLGFVSLGLLWCLFYCGTYILTAIVTAIRLPRFLRRCAREAAEEANDSLNRK